MRPLHTLPDVPTEHLIHSVWTPDISPEPPPVQSSNDVDDLHCLDGDEYRDFLHTILRKHITAKELFRNPKEKQRQDDLAEENECFTTPVPTLDDMAEASWSRLLNGQWEIPAFAQSDDDDPMPSLPDYESYSNSIHFMGLFILLTPLLLQPLSLLRLRRNRCFNATLGQMHRVQMTFHYYMMCNG